MTTDHVATLLANATPVEIDTALAEIYTRMYAEWDQIERLSRYIADMEQGIAKYEAGNLSYSSFTQDALDDLLDKRLDHEDKAREIQAETLPYEAEFARRPWTRFYLVDNNGGHIHSSMGCQTCNKRGRATRFGWLPLLSGQTEAEAVAAHGAILCTVCYPSAPLAWTDRRDDSVCTGTGKFFNRDLPHRGPHFYSGNWATCEDCGEQVTMVKSGKIRKHKKA